MPIHLTLEQGTLIFMAGLVVTGLGAILKKLGAIDVWQKAAEVRGTATATTLSEVRADLKELKTEVGGQGEKLSRIEGLVLDPMQRIPTLEKQMAAKDVVIAQLEFGVHMLTEELGKLRDWRHKVETGEQAILFQQAVANERAKLADVARGGE